MKNILHNKTPSIQFNSPFSIIHSPLLKTFIMKNIILITLLSLTSPFWRVSNVLAQNLVPNPSFEDTLNCAQHFGLTEAAFPWFTATYKSSPDYFSANNNCGFNPFGFQLPHSGVAYMGGYAWLGKSREYYGVRLDSTLQSNIKYKAGFYVSRAEGFRHATDRIGIYFCADTAGFYGNPAGQLYFIPQVENASGNILSDTANWTLITQTFLAVGGEQFLVIGNFRDSANTTVLIVDSNAHYNGAYYYVDDVFVYRCDTCSLTSLNNPSSKTTISVSPNPMNKSTVLNFISTHEFLKTIYVIDLNGNIKEKIIIPNIEINYRVELKRKSLSQGIYFLKIESNINTYNYKLIII